MVLLYLVCLRWITTLLLVLVIRMMEKQIGWFFTAGNNTINFFVVKMVCLIADPFSDQIYELFLIQTD